MCVAWIPVGDRSVVTRRELVTACDECGRVHRHSVGAVSLDDAAVAVRRQLEADGWALGHHRDLCPACAVECGVRS